VPMEGSKHEDLRVVDYEGFGCVPMEEEERMSFRGRSKAIDQQEDRLYADGRSMTKMDSVRRSEDLSTEKKDRTTLSTKIGDRCRERSGIRSANRSEWIRYENQ